MTTGAKVGRALATAARLRTALLFLAERGVDLESNALTISTVYGRVECCGGYAELKPVFAELEYAFRRTAPYPEHTFHRAYLNPGECPFDQIQICDLWDHVPREVIAKTEPVA